MNRMENHTVLVTSNAPSSDHLIQLISESLGSRPFEITASGYPFSNSVFVHLTSAEDEEWLSRQDRRGAFLYNDPGNGGSDAQGSYSQSDRPTPLPIQIQMEHNLSELRKAVNILGEIHDKFSILLNTATADQKKAIGKCILEDLPVFKDKMAMLHHHISQEPLQTADPRPSLPAPESRPDTLNDVAPMALTDRASRDRDPTATLRLLHGLTKELATARQLIRIHTTADQKHQAFDSWYLNMEVEVRNTISMIAAGVAKLENLEILCR